MRKLFYILLFFSRSLQAQNIVPNYSFEDTANCEIYYNKAEAAYPWFTANSTPDYFSSTALCGWPFNALSYQIPRTGKAMMAIVCYETGCNMEYFEAPLILNLISGIEYCVSFYVVLDNLSNYAIDRIGIFFSTDTIISPISDTCYFPVKPQIESALGTFLTDTVNWALISGRFIATGGEKFITIGNFHSNDSTNLQNAGGSFSSVFYYIDDICVSPVDSCLCDSTLNSTQENLSEKGITVYPTLTNGKIHIESKAFPISKVYVLNNLGDFFLLPIRIGNSVDLQLNSFPSGMYFLNIQLVNNYQIRKKILLINN